MPINPLNHIRHLRHGSLSLQTPGNSLNHNSHLHLEPLGHTRDHTPHCIAHKDPKTLLTTPDTYTVGPWAIQRTTPSLWSPQAPSNLLNSTRHLHLGSLQGPKNSLNYTRHLHCGSLGHTRDRTLTAEPTSPHKLPEPHQTPTLWVFRPYKGQPLHRGAPKCPQTP